MIEFVKVKRIIKKQSPDKVYNIRIPKNHNYFANNILVHNCDDPHDMKNVLALTETVLKSQIEWWDNAWTTRKNQDGVMILVMQRLHDKDIAGHELEKGGWEHLMLPQEYDPKRSKVTCIGFKDPRTKDDELLNEELFDYQALQQAKKDLGARGYASQHSQNPSAKSGNLFKRSYWGSYRELPAEDTWTLYAHSWDTAYKAKESNDYWGFCSGIKAGSNLYITDYSRRRMEVPEGEQAIRNLYYRDRPDAVLIEDKASGQSILQFAHASDDMIPAIAIKVKGDKFTRATIISPKCEAGYILLPDPRYIEAPWVDLFIEDLARFPVGESMDGVDAFTQLVRYVWESIVDIMGDADYEGAVDRENKIKQYTSDDRHPIRKKEIIEEEDNVIAISSVQAFINDDDNDDFDNDMI